MATAPVTTNSSSSSTDATAAALSNSLGNLNVNDFLKMLLAELQNQDPLSPMDSTTMLTQISQISQVGSTQSLTNTLQSVLLGQSLGNATSLIGKTVTGLADDGTNVTGQVDKVSISNNEPVLNIGDASIQLTNVQAVLPDSVTNAAASLLAPAAAPTDPAAQAQQLLQQLQSGQIQPTTATK